MIKQAVLELLPVASTLAAVVLGAVLTGAGALLQGVLERRRSLQKLLFQLLELRHELVRRDPDLIERVLTTFMERTFGMEGAKAIGAPESRALLEAIARALREEVVEARAGGSTFADAVAAIAPDDAILAHRLSGHEKRLDFEGLMKKYFEAVLRVPGVVTQPDDERAATIVQQTIVAQAFRLARAELTEALREVSTRLAPWTWWKVRRLIENQDAHWNAEMDDVARELVERVAEEFRKPPETSGNR